MIGDVHPYPTFFFHRRFGGHPLGQPDRSEVTSVRFGPRHCGQSAAKASAHRLVNSSMHAAVFVASILMAVIWDPPQ
jgi:hypothetical protein